MVDKVNPISGTVTGRWSSTSSNFSAKPRTSPAVPTLADMQRIFQPDLDVVEVKSTKE